MASRILIKAEDGHEIDCWFSEPSNKPKGGIIFLQAIYGLTPHLGNVCDWFARDGFVAIAPATYDRAEKGKVFGYDDRSAEEAMAFRQNLRKKTVILDVTACSKHLRSKTQHVAIAGFCTGGTWAWICASALLFEAAIIFYGSDVQKHLELRPRCPTMLHYGDIDHVVPIQDVKKIRAAVPGSKFHLYSGAGHAFYNPEQKMYHRDAAVIAHQRSIEFLTLQFC